MRVMHSTYLDQVLVSNASLNFLNVLINYSYYECVVFLYLTIVTLKSQSQKNYMLILRALRLICNEKIALKY